MLDSLAELTAKKTKKQHKYSVREPLVGSGFHLRDSPGNENCRVWSGPEKTSTLYLPTPQGKQISLLFWLGGFAPEVEIDAMKIDGVEESFWTEAAGNQILLVVPCVPKSDFVKVEFCLNKISLQTGDSRLLGFNLASYGWRDRK